MHLKALVALGFSVALLCEAATAEEAYKFLNEILIDGEGGWDYVTVDAAARFLVEWQGIESERCRSKDASHDFENRHRRESRRARLRAASWRGLRFQPQRKFGDGDQRKKGRPSQLDRARWQPRVRGNRQRGRTYLL